MPETPNLHARRHLLRVALRSEPVGATRAELHLELGILEKLLLDPYQPEPGIARATAHLQAALRLLPLDAIDSRQRALFVLGLTHGDQAAPEAAVACFEAVAAVEPRTPAGCAARGYAATYREHFGLAG